MGNFASKNTINDESYQGLKATSGAAHVQVMSTQGNVIYGSAVLDFGTLNDEVIISGTENYRHITFHISSPGGTDGIAKMRGTIDAAETINSLNLSYVKLDNASVDPWEANIVASAATTGSFGNPGRHIMLFSSIAFRCTTADAAGPGTNGTITYMLST